MVRPGEPEAPGPSECGVKRSDVREDSLNTHTAGKVVVFNQEVCGRHQATLTAFFFLNPLNADNFCVSCFFSGLLPLWLSFRLVLSWQLPLFLH